MIRNSSWMRLARNWSAAFFDLRRVVGAANLPRYISDWRRYGRLSGAEAMRWNESYPCLTDWTPSTGFDAHYFYQASWAARKLSLAQAFQHVDVGSSVMMIGVLSGFVPTLFVDYRPLLARLPGLSSIGGDLKALPFASDSIPSLSSLHVIEHVGLGRYGDALDPQGSIKAIQELVRVLAPNGQLLLSVPVGRERVQFNAHRVFDPLRMACINPQLRLNDFSFVDDHGTPHWDAMPAQAAQCEYACGLYDFRKRDAA